MKINTKGTTTGGSVGVSWESYRFDLTAYNNGSILGGSAVPILDTTGVKTLNLRSIYDAACANMVLASGTGLTVSTITGNFDTNPPGVEFDPRDVFADYDAATDEIAVTASVTGSGGAGTFVFWSKNGSRMNDHFSVGCVGGNRYFRRRLGGGTDEYSTAGAAQVWHMVHYTGAAGCIRAALGAAEPADPYAPSLVHFPGMPENVGGANSSAATWSAANLRGAIVGIQAGSIVVSELSLWRLAKDSA